MFLAQANKFEPFEPKFALRSRSLQNMNTVHQPAAKILQRACIQIFVECLSVTIKSKVLFNRVSLKCI